MPEARNSLSGCLGRESLTATLRSELRAIQPGLPADWPDDALFKADLSLDSLDLVELVARTEQQLQMLIPDPDLPRFVSLQAMVDYLLDRRQGLS
jgi:acyl carrier protein